MPKLINIDPPLCVVCMQCDAQTFVSLEYDLGTCNIDVCLECVTSFIIECDAEARPVMTQEEINTQRDYCN